jgi:uracil-DNA glycosylase
MKQKYEINKVTKKIHPGWQLFFDTNGKDLEDILNQVNKSGESNVIFPNPSQLFRTLFYFPPEETKLVILGQDPYIGSEIHEGQKIPQACGLSFSVPKTHKIIPPSLKNIFKEISNSYPDYQIPTHGFLKRWVRKENIILLNSALTVIEKKSNTHQALWGEFTEKLIKFISDHSPHTVFLLMGNFAIGKSKLIDKSKHKIFTTVHPSPLSASNGFFGSGVFANINIYLESKQIEPVNWKL